MVGDTELTVLHLLCEAKIDQLQMTFGIDQDILGLHVSVCNALLLVKKF